MKKQNLKIGIVSADDPTDKTSWSGIHYCMNKALKKEFSTVIHFGPIRLCKLNYFIMNSQLLICQLFHIFFYRKKYNTSHSRVRSRYYSGFFDKAIRKNKVDVIFAPAASIEIAHLKTDIPICYFSDATVSLMCNYYDSFKNFSKKSVKISNEIEQRAINKSVTQVFSSKWAFDSAKSDYVSRNTFLVKMGANIDDTFKKEDLVKKYDSEINILFVGVNWKRKGGDIALETIDRLNKKGYNVNFTVCGCTPPQTHPKMDVIPFLDKNKKDDMLKIQELYKKAHLFLMPTRADCTPISFCEANAYGLPVITTDTGGVSSIIENGINGFMLPTKAGSHEYSNLIEELISNKEKLKKLSKSSREKYLKELNWKQWGQEMKKILLLTFCISNYGDNSKYQVLQSA